MVTPAVSPPPRAGVATLSLVRLVGPVTGQTAGVAALQLVLTGQWTGGRWVLSLTAGEGGGVTTG